MYTYRQILKQAFNIARTKTSLWFFGFFVAFLGTAGELEVFFGSLSTGKGGLLTPFFGGLLEGGLFTWAGLTGIGTALISSPLYFFIITFLSLVAIAFSVLIIWLVIVSQSAIIGQTVAVSQNKTFLFRDSFSFGMSKFWPVLGVNFLFRASTWLILIIAGFLSFMHFPGSVYVFIIVFDILLFLTIIISFVARYAICGVVLRGWKIKDAFSQAWTLFRNNWILSIEISVILFFIYLLINSLLFFLLGLVFLTAFDMFAGFTLGLYLISLILLAIFIVVEIILSIFYWATWALVFEIIASRREVLKSVVKRTLAHLMG